MVVFYTDKKMDSKPSYKQWINLYNTDIEYVWDSQCTELRSAAMLLKALEIECKRMYYIYFH